MKKTHLAHNAYTINHQGDDVGILYTHAGRRNAHVLFFHSAMAQSWIQGNPWLIQQIAHENQTDKNPTGYFITVTREEESTIKLELGSRLASTNKLSSGYLFDGNYMNDVVHEALTGKATTVDVDVVREAAEYLHSYLY